ncbi:hypothetical protein IWQ48_003165 [Labrenzia sp. EL_13]|nr:hypothetical protein [Labrenzia sp. EL_13]
MTRLHITAQITQFFWLLSKEKSCKSELAMSSRHKATAALRTGLFVVLEVSILVGDALPGIFRTAQ